MIKDKFKPKLNKKYSMTAILVISFLIIIVIQTGVLLFNFLLLQTGEKLDMNSYLFIQEKAKLKANEIENIMINYWSNDAYMSQVVDKAQVHYEEHLKSKTPIVLDADLAQSMIDMVSTMKVDAAFVYIEDENNDYKDVKNIVEIKDSNVNLYMSDMSDITLVTGDDKISMDMNIAFDTRWTPTITDTTYNREIYYDALRRAKHLEYENYDRFTGFWYIPSKSILNDTSDYYFIRPLIDKSKNKIYGIIGIRGNNQTIEKILNYKDIGKSLKNAYILTNKKYESDIYATFFTAAISGPYIEKILGKNENILKKSKNKYYSSDNELTEYTMMYSIDDREYSDLFIFPYRVNIYKDGSLNDGEHFTLLTVVDKSDINIYSNELYNSLIEIIGMSIFIGVIIIYIISVILSKPVKKLSHDIEKVAGEGNLVKLKRINVTEFDNLVGVIEELSQKLLENSKRFQNIISQASIPIVAIEKNNNEDVINKLGTISSIFEDFYKDEQINEKWNIEQYSDFNEKLFEKSTLMDCIYDIEKDTQTDIYEKEWNGKTIYYKLTTRRLEVEEGQVIYTGVDDYNKVTTFIGESRTVQVISDYTREMTEKIKISRERNYDNLTGLLNRLSFKEKVEEFLDNDEQLAKNAAMIMWDLDDLKYINDTYGHDFGDEYIQAAAKVLSISEKNNSYLARVSGDEFFAFVEYGKDKAEIMSLVENIKYEMMMSHVYTPNKSSVKIRATAGICWYPQDGTTYHELHRNADFAMYSGKNSNKGSISQFDIHLYNKNYILLSGKEDINKFIEERQVRYAFQPIVDTRDGSVFAYEALMRSASPSIKNVVDVLRLSKNQSKYSDIEIMTFEEVLSLVNKNLDKFDDKKIFINSISNTVIPDDVKKSLNTKYSHFLNKLVIELTESEDFDEKCLELKQQMKKDFDCMIAIDDFGAGYATDSWLLQTSPDFVKIDMQLIRGIDKDRERQTMVENILRFNNEKNIKTIAEGIETYEEMKVLIEMGVNYLQGFYLGKPDYEIKDISDEKKREIQVIYSIQNIDKIV